MKTIRAARLIFCLLAIFGTSACIGTAIEATTDAAIAVGKVPFKVGGAVIDVATGDDEEKTGKQNPEPKPPL